MRHTNSEDCSIYNRLPGGVDTLHSRYSNQSGNGYSNRLVPMWLSSSM